ncbi:MAG: hypothetical protein ACREWG_05585 [Gammaproteobacteria bacterium]
MNLDTPDKENASQSAGLDRFEPAFLSAEILRTYTRRNAVFGHDATNTPDSPTGISTPRARRNAVFGHDATSAASTTLWRAPVEGLGTADAKRWDPERWMAEMAKRPSFQLETRSPSHSRSPSPRQPSVAESILHVKEELNAPFAERLAQRLHHLANISEEEYPRQAPISPESLEDFVAFLRFTPNRAYPGVVLTHSGNIQAEWRRSDKRHFAVEFVGNSDLHFVVFAPDPKNPHKTMRASGVATVGSLVDIVRPYGVDSWATESNRRAA